MPRPYLDTRLSESMEGEELQMKKQKASFTIDCLQRRLLAERMESKAALADVEILQKRVLELERRLEEEMELARKAENAFRSAIEELECLDLLSLEFGITANNSVITARRSWSKSTRDDVLQHGQTVEGKGREQREEGTRRERTLSGAADSKDHEQTQKMCFTPRSGEFSGYPKSHDICVT